MQGQRRGVWVALATVLLIIGIVIMSIGVAQINQQRQEANTQPTQTATTSATATSTPIPLPSGNDWTQYRYDLASTGVNPEKSLTTSNVSQLKLSWSNLTTHPFEATPAVVNGVVYIVNDNSLLALDLLTGKQRWEYTGIPQKRSALSSSVAVDTKAHLAFYGSPDAYVYAVDINTGKGVWHTQIGDPTKGAYIWSSPSIYDGSVYIGLASRDDQPCVRGALFAFDELTGKQKWVHYASPAGLLGAGIWSSPAILPAKNWVIVTTGNPCSGTVSGFEEDAVLGIDMTSGKTVWKYTAMAYDDCDCDFGQGPTTFSYNGQQYVAAGNKYGKIWMLRVNGNSVQEVWNKRISGTGYLNEGGIFEPPSYNNGIVYFSGGPTLDNSCPDGAIWALKVTTGDVVWKQCSAKQVVSPAAIVGGVIFVPQYKTVVAYNAATGNKLWSADLNGSTWGGVAVSRGWVVLGTVPGRFYAYTIPKS